MAKDKPADALIRYMVRLASDVDALASFMSAPEKAMAAAKLTQEQQDLLRSGDQGRIYAYLKNLPPPPAAPASPPPQLPTVVATLNMQAPQPAAAQAQQPYAYAAAQPIWLIVTPYWPQR